MKNFLPFCFLLSGLSACGDVRFPDLSVFNQDPASLTAPEVPVSGGVDVADVDAVASEAAQGAEAQLTSRGIWNGQAEAVASLGDPLVPGLWLETPLVVTEQTARLRSENGAEVTVTLKPAPDAGGGRLSIAAMRALGVPLTELVPLRILPAT